MCIRLLNTYAKKRMRETRKLSCPSKIFKLIHTCMSWVLPTPELPRKATLSGPFLHDVSVSPSRVNRYAEWCAIHFFCIKTSMSIAILFAHFLFVFACSTNFMLFGFRWCWYWFGWWGWYVVMCVWPLINTAFKFFSDDDKGNVLPFHIVG